MRYVVTGGTGFIGRRAVARILEHGPDAQVWVLVRRASLSRFERLAADWGERVKPLVGDLTAENLGLTDTVIAELGNVDHVLHCAAIYDITAGAAEQQAANVEGTRAVIGLALRRFARFAVRTAKDGA
jgi:thioester reductase-like protein